MNSEEDDDILVTPKIKTEDFDERIEAEDPEEPDGLELAEDPVAKFIGSEEFSETLERAFQQKIETLLQNQNSRANANLNQNINPSLDSLLEHFNEHQKQTKKHKFPEDTYSFIALPKQKTSKPFWFGIMVFAFQIALCYCLAYSFGTARITKENLQQILGFFNTSSEKVLVRLSQILSILTYFVFGGQSLNDIALAVMHLPTKEKNGKYILDCGGPSKIGVGHVSCLLRLLQGLSACLTTIVLTVRSTEVIEIVLNLTAVHFVSDLDNLAFRLARDGLYGKDLLDATRVVGTMKLPEQRVETTTRNKAKVYWTATVGFMIAMLLLIVIIYLVYSEENAEN